MYACYGADTMSLSLSPSIQAVLGDKIVVKVANAPGNGQYGNSQNVSLHWHGLHQRETPWMDGSPLTQCPIGPGAGMTYRFKADTAGTHMWHSHYKLSMLDGLWGPLVVHDTKDPWRSSYDEERLISITDFANETAVSQFANWKEFESAYYYKRTPNYNKEYDSHNGRFYIPNPLDPSIGGGNGDYYNW